MTHEYQHEKKQRVMEQLHDEARHDSTNNIFITSNVNNS